MPHRYSRFSYFFLKTGILDIPTGYFLQCTDKNLYLLKYSRMDRSQFYLLFINLLWVVDNLLPCVTFLGNNVVFLHPFPQFVKVKMECRQAARSVGWGGGVVVDNVLPCVTFLGNNAVFLRPFPQFLKETANQNKYKST
jgi:hypothetical protein